MTSTIAVAMSGGVDSSLAAALLRQQGHELVGVTAHMFAPIDEAAASAESVCHHLGIPHHVVDLREEFREIVVENFVREYASGRTPNPCVLCNRTIKWGVLLEKIREFGTGEIATGHYARVIRTTDGNVELRKGLDPMKDQSYALWRLSHAMLERTHFPIGGITKDETRALADKFDLPSAHRAESQEICFIPDDDYGRFLREWAADEGISSPALEPGPIRDSNGDEVGTHRGIAFYTIGQRKGLGVAFGEPRYVTRMDPATRTIWIGENDDLSDSDLIADQANWPSGEPPESGTRVAAKIRYLHAGMSATVHLLEGDRFRIVLDEKQRAITPGQSVVLYDADRVIGGGIIVSAGTEK
jgi:tRNA-uridine 2-sulfurtransferase